MTVISQTVEHADGDWAVLREVLDDGSLTWTVALKLDKNRVCFFANDYDHARRLTEELAACVNFQIRL